MKKLVYKVAEHNGGVIFAPPLEAIRVSQIHKAIRESKTWGEFGNLMPEDDYCGIVDTIGETNASEFAPEDDDYFDCEQVPGYTDGDYPTWLQQEMDLYLPRDVLDRYAKRENTMLNGAYWMIPEENLDSMCSELRESGWELVQEQEWEFY